MTFDHVKAFSLSLTCKLDTQRSLSMNLRAILGGDNGSAEPC